MAKTRKNRGGGYPWTWSWFNKSKPPATNDVSQGQQAQTQLQVEQPQVQTSISINFQPPNHRKYNLLVSHNNRIQSWLDPLLKTQDYYCNVFRGTNCNAPIKPKKSFFRTNKDKKMRFSNGAAISLVFHNNNVIIDMVYPGDLKSNKPGKPYWGIVNNPKKKIIKFENLNISLDTFMQTLNIEKSIDNLKEKNFLIVRHGEATHNLWYSTHMTDDTLLTKQGVEQAQTLGTELQKIGIKIKKECYVSDLIRTGMTAWAIGTTFFNDKNSFQSYVVVPCNNEVKDETGDTGVIQTYGENKTRCEYKKECLDNGKCIQPSCARCFNLDNGTPRLCSKDVETNINLTNKYNFKFHKDFILKGNLCKNDFFQQLNIVFDNTNEPNTIEDEYEDEEPDLFLYQAEDTLSTGGSNYKRSKKMKYRKKFTKRGGKKSKLRKTSKPSKK
jgi:hypothetical protein